MSLFQVPYGYKQRLRLKTEHALLAQSTIGKAVHRVMTWEISSKTMADPNMQSPARDEAGATDNVAAFSPLYDNGAALDSLLAKMEDSALSQSDKGTRFEQMVLAYFTNDSVLSSYFDKVQLYADWAAEHPEYAPSKKDYGIDLMATLSEEGKLAFALEDAENEAAAALKAGTNIKNARVGGGNADFLYTNPARLDSKPFVAIQCKFYDRAYTLKKDDIDSFLAAANKTFISRLYVVTTCGKISDNLSVQLQDNSKPVTILSRAHLAQASFSWDQYLRLDRKIVQNKCELRDYQVTALNNVIEGFKTNDRGKLIMACGTGKTFTSLKIAEKQAGKKGFVLFLVPSLALLAQTLSEWKQQSDGKLTAFAVCSDTKIGQAKAAQRSLKGVDFEDDTIDLIARSELAFPATTDGSSLAFEVNNALNKNQASPDNGLTVVFSTYQSIEAIAEAQHEHGMPEFDLIICDEAHRTAGAYLVTDLKDQSKAKKKRGRKAANTAPLLADTEAAVEAANSVAMTVTETTPESEESAKHTGLDSVDENEAMFTRIHNKEYVLGKKRLYMTATPKVYGEAAKEQENSGEAVLYSMDDESVFGPVFHTLNFDLAVKYGCLVDYKVIILAVDKNVLPSEEALADFSENNQAKVVGTWKALNKQGLHEQLTDDAQPMKRAVAFAQCIEPNARRHDAAASKAYKANFQSVVSAYRKEVLNPSKGEVQKDDPEYQFVLEHGLDCECEHIDGSMDAIQKSSLLSWLREDPEDGQCKILFNVRCLSEGVDVPALDAVVFLSPRRSQVDVVQIVGRVMRRAPGKTRGYIIIPVVTDDIDNPEKVMTNTPAFKVVWEVLSALKSINPHHVLVDKVLNKLDDRIEVVCVSKSSVHGKQKSNGGGGGNPPPGPGPDPIDPPLIDPTQGSLGIDEHVLKVEGKIKAAIINKLGKRKEWEEWAEDVGHICSRQVEHIKEVLANSDAADLKQAFAKFKQELTAAMSRNLDDDEIIEMLAQHIVIKPVLDELFREYPFTEHNPIAKALTQMLERLDAEGLTKANKDLAGFYATIGFRMQSVKTLKERQTVIVELFDRFFKVAFPKLQEKLGIVYTPVEVVDFINNSVDAILEKEFGCHIADSGVHVLDPFTGTGTFITRLMQDRALIPYDKLEHKYLNELHAFEILPLAYYVASINIESVFYEQSKSAGHEVAVKDYQSNKVVVLTDTFGTQQSKVETLFASPLSENSRLRKQVEGLDLRVIIGNPPYSVGQDSQNDDNQNDSYPDLDARLAETYVELAGKVQLKNMLYDSYIRAFRWASDHIKDQGVIAFVSNAGWLDSAPACGMRRCLAEEFSSIYVYHLKGNQRTSGEQSRREGGKIFGAGSRAPIAITILVKNSKSKEQGKIQFATVDDYLSREEKLAQLNTLGSVLNAPLQLITPDEHGDWINQRRNDFSKFITVDGKKTDGLAVFSNYSRGIATSRDAWSYNASKLTIADSFNRCIAFYNDQVSLARQQGEAFVRSNDPTQIKWDVAQIRELDKGNSLPDFDSSKVTISLYRPFFKQWFYNDKQWINRTCQMPSIFPFEGTQNLTINASGVGAKNFSCFMSNSISCLDQLEKTQCYPRYIYRKVDDSSALKPQRVAPLLFAGLDDDDEPQHNGLQSSTVINGYVREDAIKPEAVEHFRTAYPEAAAEIDADSVFYYIYGILHSPEYRSTYSNNLQKELPRIPRVASYSQFADFEMAGRALAALHVNYEQVEPYKGCSFAINESAPSLRVTALKYGKIKGKTGNAAKKKDEIIYNEDLVIKDIPLAAQEYIVNKKSALDWLVERCCVKVDRDSQIVNDFNDFAEAMNVDYNAFVKAMGGEVAGFEALKGDNHFYTLLLILRVITVSLRTVEIVKALPPLTIHELDK